MRSADKLFTNSTASATRLLKKGGTDHWGLSFDIGSGRGVSFNNQADPQQPHTDGGSQSPNHRVPARSRRDYRRGETHLWGRRVPTVDGRRPEAAGQCGKSRRGRVRVGLDVYFHACTWPGGRAEDPAAVHLFLAGHGAGR